MYNSECVRFMVVVTGLLEILIFSGTILGWTSLKLMLKNEGVYSYLCQENNQSIHLNHQQPNRNYGSSTAAQNIDPVMINATTDSMLDQVQDNPTTKKPDPESEEKIPKSVAKFKNLNSNFTLKIDLTLIGDGDNQSIINKPLVIPFETNGKYDQNFIYQLLNDTNLILRSNSTNVKVNLVSDPQKSSKFEEYLDLYLVENLPPPLLPTDNISGCKQQEVKLNLAFSIGSFCMGATAFIWGFLLEKLGLRIVRLIINAMFSLGAFMLCFVQEGRDWLLFPALLIMSLSGVPIRIANMQISNLYPPRRSTIISIYSGAFSASSIIYVILHYIYTNTPLDFFWVNFSLVILSLATIPFTVFVLPKDKVREPSSCTLKKNSSESETNIHSKQDKFPPVVYDKNHNIQSISSSSPIESKLFSEKSSTIIDTKSSSIQLQNYKSIASPNLSQARKKGVDNKAFIADHPSSTIDQANVNGVGEKSNEAPPSDDDDEKQCAATPTVAVQFKPPPPLRLSLMTFAYNLHQLWFSWMITYMVMYVGSLDLWAKRVTEDIQSQSLYFSVYGLVQVLALVVSPIAGLMMDWKLAKAKQEPDPITRRVKQYQSGFWPLFITSFALLICVFCHYFDREEFIYISIIFMTIYRSFLLAVGSAFLRIRFHPEHFNQLLGIMSSISAVTSLLQIPLYSWEKNSEFNVIHVNILNTLVALLVMSNSLYLLITPLQRYFVLKEEANMKKYS